MHNSIGTLIITTHSFEPSEFTKELVQIESRDVNWLRLWPTIPFEVPDHVNQFTSIDFITEKDHLYVKNHILNYSSKWLKYTLMNNDFRSIDGICIDRLLSYEIEQSLTPILLRLCAIHNAIDQLNPDHLIFSDNKGELENKFHNWVNNFSYGEFYKGRFSSVKQIDIPNYSGSSPVQNVRDGLDKLFNKSYFTRAYYKIRNNRKNTVTSLANKIIISKTSRCLSGFLKYLPDTYDVMFLETPSFASDDVEHQISWEYKPQGKIDQFHGRSLIDIQIEIIEICIQKYHKLNKLLHFLEGLKGNPKMYITVNMAESTELLKLHYFNKRKIKSVWSSEGLGQPVENVKDVFNSVFHFDLAVERWCLSENFSECFDKHRAKTKVTGYLESSFDGSRSSAIGIENNILVALSPPNYNAARPLVTEDIFETLETIRSISEIACRNPDLEFCIKLHPADNNLHLYKPLFSGNKNVTIHKFKNIERLIEKARVVVIYDSSVGIEALYRGRHVVSHVHSNRPNYITHLASKLPSDPNAGPSIHITKNTKHLEKIIKECINFSYNSYSGNQLNRFLENNQNGYSMERVVQKLLSV